MREYKNKTLALVLASVVSIAGAFAADNYKNSVMALTFENNSGNINMIVQTKQLYNQPLSMTKQGDLYILTLPDVNSQAPTPDISDSNGIESVNIRTMPYTANGNGYTRITVKTNGSTNLDAKSVIYVPPIEEPRQLSDSEYERNERSDEYEQPESREPQRKVSPPAAPKRQIQTTSNDEFSSFAKWQKQREEEERTERVTREKSATEPEQVNTTPVSVQPQAKPQKASYDVNLPSRESILLIFGALFIIIGSIFIYNNAKGKMTEIIGERLDIDVDEDDNNKKNKKKKEPKKKNITSINNINKKFKKPISAPSVEEYTKSEEKPEDSQNIIPEERTVIDIDQIFNETVKQQEEAATTTISESSEEERENEEEENVALEEFLNDYYNEEEISEETPEEGLNENKYQEIINSNDITFDEDDRKKINSILNLEINDNTLKNIDDYAVSVPVKPSPDKVLENLMTTYASTQNIKFEPEDVEILRKLIQVEIDPDFIHDLKTDPERTKQMEAQILAMDAELKKPQEIMTLKVADFLPDLADVAAHPEKYEVPEPERVTVDETTMLKNIENVTFKPFYDGSQEIEILNVFDEEKEEEIIEITKTPRRTPEQRRDSELKSVQAVNRKLQNHPSNTAPKPQAVQQNTASANIKAVCEGKAYNVVSTINLNNNIGCHLAKNEDGYFVLGYIGDKLVQLKHYEELKTEKIQARLSERLKDGGLRYIIRIGVNKFLLDVKNNDIKYLMDL